MNQSVRQKPALVMVLALLLASISWGQATNSSPEELVRAAIQNQIADSSQPRLFAWKERKHRGARIETQSVVETPDGTLTRVTLIDNKPLTPEQRADEEQRLRRMCDPAQLKHARKDREEDDARTRQLLASIPDAFSFTVLGNSMAANGHRLVRMAFVARPDFAPPSREALVFTGMKGEMVVDESARRLVKIDGTLFKEVTFGWGILGKLYSGGRFLIEQEQVTPEHWEATRSVLHFDGKALLIKPIHIDEDESAWDFKPVPPMSVAEAVQYLASSSQAQQNANLAP
jgi:hypothetical protein